MSEELLHQEDDNAKTLVVAGPDPRKQETVVDEKSKFIKASTSVETNDIKAGSSADTAATDYKRKESNQPEGTFVEIDIPAPLDGILRNTPEVRAILRSVRAEIKDAVFGHKKQKSKIIRRMKALSVSKKLSRRQKRKMEQLEIELRVHQTKVEADNNPYTDFKAIGKGGFGEVYRARDKASGEEIVLKIVNEVSEANFQRLLRESKTLITLEHDGILKGFLLKKTGPKGVLGLPGSQNKFLIETEYVRGESLEKISKTLLQDFEAIKQKAEDGPIDLASIGVVLEEWERLGVDTSAFDGDKSGNVLEILQKIKDHFIIDVISQACFGLDHAHKAGVLHRDIKPANLMVTNEGKTKVIDWGLVKTREIEKAFPAEKSKVKRSKFETDAGDIVGTPVFMSPEQAKGKKPTAQSDIWELGVTLVKCLTGILPVDAPNIKTVIEMLSKYELNWDVLEKNIQSPLLLSIVKKALAFQPKNRFISAKEFHNALELYNALENEKSLDTYLHQRTQEEKSSLQLDFGELDEITEEDIRRMKEDLLGEGRNWDLPHALDAFQELIEYEAQFA